MAPPRPPPPLEPQAVVFDEEIGETLASALPPSPPSPTADDAPSGIPLEQPVLVASTNPVVVEDSSCVVPALLQSDTASSGPNPSASRPPDDEVTRGVPYPYHYAVAIAEPVHEDAAMIMMEEAGPRRHPRRHSPDLPSNDPYAVATAMAVPPDGARDSSGVLVVVPVATVTEDAAVAAQLLEMQRRARWKRNCWVAGSVVGSVVCCLLIFPLLTSVYLVAGRDNDFNYGPDYGDHVYNQH
jgi:hypothetical protein